MTVTLGYGLEEIEEEGFHEFISLEHVVIPNASMQLRMGH
jgi:hypothetical protein